MSSTRTKFKPLQVVQDYVQSLSEKDFIETFFFIIDKERREIPMLFNLVQKKIYENRKKFNVILKYRKPGVSVFVQLLFLCRCLRMKNRNCVVLSYDKESTQRMLERTEWTLNKLKAMGFPFTLERDNKNEFKIKETNSKLFIGVAGSKAFGRGDDITDLHISELAWWDDTSIMTGLLEALTNDAQVYIESTANGSQNLYAQLVRKARNASALSDWAFHFFPWHFDSLHVYKVPADFVHTEDEKELARLYKLTPAQLMWRRKKMEDMLEPELFEQEFPSSIEGAFMVLGACIFKKSAIVNYQKYGSEPVQRGEVVMASSHPEFRMDPDGLLKVWEFPVLGESYMLIGDASDPESKRSTQGDPACLQLLKIRNAEQVAVWHGFREPYDLGRIAYALGLFYNTAMAVIERASGGISTLDCLRNLGYAYIYKMQDIQYGDLEETQKIGWITNSLTRPLIIGAIKEYINGQFYQLHDAESIGELSTFIRDSKSGKIEAAPGCHDDRVITLAIGAYLRSVTPITADFFEDRSYVDRFKEQDRGVVVPASGKGGY